VRETVSPPLGQRFVADSRENPAGTRINYKSNLRIAERISDRSHGDRHPHARTFFESDFGTGLAATGRYDFFSRVLAMSGRIRARGIADNFIQIAARSIVLRLSRLPIHQAICLSLNNKA